MRDFFISYTKADKAWATWIAQTLEDAGYTTVIQAWDFTAGANFVVEMHKAATQSNRTLAVISPDYFNSKFCESEWAAAFAQDADSEKRKLIPVRVVKCQPPGLLGPIVYIDLVDLPEEQAKQTLLAMIKDGRAKPADKVPFPGKAKSRVAFPGPAAYEVDLLHQLRPIPAEFVGREKEIAFVLGQIRQGNGEGVPVCAICSVAGMGGVGKTELANMAGHKLAKDYPDAHLFIPLGTYGGAPLSARQAMEYCLTCFNPQQRVPENDNLLALAYRSAFNGKRCLMILDDAKDDAQVEALKPPAGSAVIVTSRKRLACCRMDSLEALPPAEAVKLLRQLCPRLNEPQAAEVAKWCGCLPLALKVAGSHLQINHTEPVEAYLEKLGGSTRLKQLAEGNLNVQEVFAASVAHLQPVERAAFGALSIMTASFDRPAALAVIGGEAEDALNTLARHHLLAYDETTQRFRWHDLLREFAEKQAVPEDLEAAHLRHAQHFEKIGAQTDEYYLKGGENVMRGLALFDQEKSHLEAAFQWLSTREDHEAAKILVGLVDAVVYSIGLRFHPRKMIAWLEAQSKAAQFVGDRQSEGNALGNLGNAYTRVGEPRKAFEFYEKRLVIAREIGDRQGEGNALGNLGNAYRNLGETRKAIEFCVKALVIDRESGDRRGEGADLGNLGLAYADLGKPLKAIEFYEKALVIDREIGDRQGEGSALGSLGLAYADLGEHHKAIEFYEKHLAIVREIGDRRGEGVALGNLGVAYKNLCEPRKAIDFYEKQLAIAREIGDRKGEGNALWNSALALRKIGEPADAIRLAQAALKIYEAIEDPGAAKDRQILAEWRAEAKPDK